MPLFLDFMLVAGITVTIIIMFLIVKQKEKQLPHVVLVIFFAILLCMMINLYSNIHRLKVVALISYIPHHIARWTIGPILLVYVRSLFLERKMAIKKSILHFLPVVLFGIFVSLPTLITSSVETINIDYVHFFKKHSFFITQLSNGYTLIYLIISYVLLSKYSKSITAVYANITKRDIRWISHILIGGSILILINSVIDVYQYTTEVYSTNYSNLFTLLGLILFILYLGYYGVHQSNILLPDFLLKKHKENNESSFAKEEESKFIELKLQLEHVLHTQKPYTDNELTLVKLAGLVSTTDKKLSELLNQYMGISFYDIINKYRTNAVN